MPYLIRGNDVDKDAVSKRFYPDFPMAKKRPFLNNQPVSQAQKDEIPRTLLVEPPTILHRLDPLPELLGWDMGFKIVYPPMKALIEKLEPGVHEFIPLEVKSQDGSASFGTYYLVLITQEVDALVYEETKFNSGYGVEADKNARLVISPFGRPVLRTDAVRGYHLWRGVGGLVHHYFCSDDIGQFIKDNKLRGWRLDECVMRGSKLH